MKLIFVVNDVLQFVWTLNLRLGLGLDIQGVFLTGAPLKVLSVRLHSKSHQKSSKCQNLLTEKTCDF